MIPCPRSFSREEREEGTVIHWIRSLDLTLSQMSASPSPPSSKPRTPHTEVTGTASAFASPSRKVLETKTVQELHDLVSTFALDTFTEN